MRRGPDRFRRRFSWAVALCISFAWSAEAAGSWTCPRPVTVSSASSADELALHEPVHGTQIVRLAGIDRPELTSSSAPVDKLREAEAALRRLMDGRTACVLLSEGQQDRYGRLLAHVYRDDGLWVQGELLRLGLARVHVRADARALAVEMLAIENEARRAGRGIWSDSRFRVRSVHDIGRDLGTFQLVEGRVIEAQRSGDRWYLNFGDDWRSDFTVVVPAKALPAFAAAKLDLYGLKGRTIRVRGWTELLNGPMIEATIPEQIEPLGE